MPEATALPRISVILPIHNGGRFLRESIQSVLDQTFEQFELIAFDDASTDESAQIVREFVDPRIRRFQADKNGGLFPTLNAAIREARGSILKLWAQDDVMAADCLEETIRFLDRYPGVGFCYSACVPIDENGRAIRDSNVDETPEFLPSELALRIMNLHGSISANISTVAIPTWAFSSAGPFDERLKVSGDFEYWVRLAQRNPVGHITRPLVSVRRHLGQLSRSKSSGVLFIVENARIFQELLKAVPERFIPDRLAWDRRHRLRLYVHHAFLEIRLGRIREARRILQAVWDEGALFRALGWWLFTLNGRLLAMQPPALADSLCAGTPRRQPEDQT